MANMWSDGPTNDDKSHIGLALFVGAKNEAAADRKHAQVVLADKQNTIDTHLADLLSTKADRDAYKALATLMLQELENPSGTRIFSDPSNAAGRVALLQNVHRQSWEDRVKRVITDGDKGLTNTALERSREFSLEIVEEYKNTKVGSAKPKPSNSK